MATVNLPLPKKLVSNDNLYCVISDSEIIIVHSTMESAVVWNMNDEERVNLKNYEGVWMLSSPGKYKQASTELGIWNRQVFHLINETVSFVDHSKTDDLIKTTGIPKKLTYKQAYKSGSYSRVGVYYYHKYPQFKYLQSKDVSVLEALTTSSLQSNIKILDGRSAESLSAFSLWLEGAGLSVAVDTETFDPNEPNGSMALLGWKCNIRMLQVYSPVTKQVMIIDFGKRGDNATQQVRFAYGKALAQWAVGKELVFQNHLFDAMVLEHQLGATFYLSKIRDTMLMSKQTWAGISQITHSLGAICQRTGVGNPDKSLQRSDFGGHLIPAQFNYGGDDTILTYECKDKLHDLLNVVGGNLYMARVDNAYSNVCHMIRRFGMYLDMDKLDEVYKKTEDYYNEKAKLWEDASGLTATVGSQMFLKWLREDRGINAPNGQKGTVKALVDKLPELQHKLDAGVAKKRLDYLKGMRASEAWRGDGCLTPGIQVSANQGIGRTSSGDLIRGMNVAINGQNGGKELREYPELPDYRPVFAAPPGYSFVSIDLSQSHARIAVYLAGCEAALKSFGPDDDFHSLNASYIALECEPKNSGFYHILSNYQKLLALRAEKCEEFSELSPESLKDLKKAAKYYRNIAKTAIYTAINFGGAKRLQVALKQVGIIVDIETCKLIMTALWQSIPEVRSYVKAKQKEANRVREWKPEEIAFLDPSEVDWDMLDGDEARDMRKKPVGFGHLTTDSGFNRYIPKYYQKWGNKPGYVSASINDVSATLWMSDEAKVIKRTQIRLLHEFILPNGYLDIMESTGYPKAWICNNAH